MQDEAKTLELSPLEKPIKRKRSIKQLLSYNYSELKHRDDDSKLNVSDLTDNQAKVTEVDEEGTITPTDLDGLKSSATTPGGKLTEAQLKALKSKSKDKTPGGSRGPSSRHQEKLNMTGGSSRRSNKPWNRQGQSPNDSFRSGGPMPNDCPKCQGRSD